MYRENAVQHHLDVLPAFQPALRVEPRRRPYCQHGRCEVHACSRLKRRVLVPWLPQTEERPWRSKEFLSQLSGPAREARYGAVPALHVGAEEAPFVLSPQTYARYGLERPDLMQVVSVAEPRPFHRELISKRCVGCARQSAWWEQHRTTGGKPSAQIRHPRHPGF